jgi:hypothetical protein
MCDKCAPLDKKIEHYEKIAVSIGDRVTVERLMALIDDLKAQKAPQLADCELPPPMGSCSCLIVNSMLLDCSSRQLSTWGRLSRLHHRARWAFQRLRRALLG